MDLIREKLEESRDSRRFKDQFHYNWSILSGATVAISINFLINFQEMGDSLISLLKIALPLIFFSMILALLRNFLSAYLTGKSLHVISTQTKLVKKLKELGIVANLLSFCSIVFYIVGVISLFVVFFGAIST
jgi:hypothetical protein